MKLTEVAPRISAAFLLVALALFRAFGSAALANRLDDTFLILIGTALVLILVPLERLKTLKAGAIEFSLHQPEVQGAITGLNLDRVQDMQLRTRLHALGDQLPVTRGARVLWIDDRPHKVIAVRRLLRALGVDVVTAVSSEMASKIFQTDNDFDLVITDVQRLGETYKETGGVDIHEGVNFIVWLRTHHQDSVVKKLPVIFYGAYDWQRLVEFTRPARELEPEAEISNSVVDLVSKVIRTLAIVRATPITATGEKEPTSPWGAA